VAYLGQRSARLAWSQIGRSRRRERARPDRRPYPCRARGPQGAGGPAGNPTNLAAAGVKGAATQRADADVFAANILPIVRQTEAAGAKTHSAIPEALNARGVPAARSGALYASTVRNLLAREQEPTQFR